MPEFKFDSLADFMTMSGHGVYVWACVVIALLLLGALLIHPLWLQKRQMAKLRHQQRLIAAQQSKHQQVINS